MGDAPAGSTAVPTAGPEGITASPVPEVEEAPAVIGASSLSRLSEDEVLEALKDVVDPELGINVVDLGLIYGVHVEEDSSVVVDMTLTSAACPLTDMIEDQADAALEGMVNALHINWVWMPPWTAAKITDDGRDQLRAMGFNV
ncbi:metal-sulfur cluster assembly factor [Raineyella sp. W15-4]|uniref:metal-sulfur cluster assembly factor n=1 Tax=Raineyella sp. W15-4 TaxID=3081651 RepID=UPI002952D894|nr:metal-sulfur cluster assembly factor [Raineyella sp. W15-4]WOQ18874.1 metal-sulfur cluster assembly factor [Raineyella sp. W15-4]